MSKPTETEIDKLVVAEAEMDERWEKPVTVNRQRKFFVIGRPTEIDANKDVLEGTPVFRGTRVPIAALLEDLENGVSIDEFIDNFPTVKREQAINVLEMLRSSLSQLKAA
jgi:uncharacterized protein (DUF433 family)